MTVLSKNHSSSFLSQEECHRATAPNLCGLGFRGMGVSKFRVNLALEHSQRFKLSDQPKFPGSNERGLKLLGFMKEGDPATEWNFPSSASLLVLMVDSNCCTEGIQKFALLSHWGGQSGV